MYALSGDCRGADGLISWIFQPLKLNASQAELSTRPSHIEGSRYSNFWQAQSLYIHSSWNVWSSVSVEKADGYFQQCLLKTNIRDASLAWWHNGIHHFFSLQMCIGELKGFLSVKFRIGIVLAFSKTINILLQIKEKTICIWNSQRSFKY